MKQNSNSRATKAVATAKRAGLRLRLAGALMAMGVGGFAYLHFTGGNHNSPAPDPLVAENKQNETPVRKPGDSPDRGMVTAPRKSHANSLKAPSASERPGADEVRRWVSSLITLDLSSGSIRAEQAEAWRQSLRQILSAGSEAVPAITEFLARNQDIDLSAVPGGSQLGYASVRQALFGALTQIGGPEAEALLADTLQTTADPREVAVLAEHLEELAPGRYRDKALSAARETLQMASEGQSIGQRDVGPLFDLFQKLGDGQSADDLLALVKNWGYYTPLTLARLPDGAGIDALIKLATDPASLGLTRSDFAYQALADAANNYPKAAEALLLQAQEGRIPPSAWSAIAETLGGIQLHITEQARTEESTPAASAGKVRWVHIDSGNQNYYAALQMSMSPEEMNRRLSLFDRLLALNSDPTVASQLQAQRKNLQSRFNPTPGRTF